MLLSIIINNIATTFFRTQIPPRASSDMAAAAVAAAAAGIPAKPLFGTARSTRSAGPRMSTPSSSGRWDPAHDILSDSDSDEERLFAKLDANVDRRRRGKR